jgi:hypothetical protein
MRCDQHRLIDGQHQDIVEMADALGDIVVVAFGMAIEMGWTSIES